MYHGDNTADTGTMRLLLVANRTCRARERMQATIDELRRHGLTVTGAVGDANLLQAIADALVGFSASRVMISTWPAGASNWLEKDLPDRAAERFGLPIHHVISPYDLPLTRAVA